MDEIKFDGNKLFQIRKEKGLSQEKLALAVGVTRQTIYLWESNQSLPDVEKVSKICKVLEIELADLVDGVEGIEIKNSTKTSNDETTHKSKKMFKKIAIIIVIFMIVIYVFISTIKFVNLNNVISKWKKLNKSEQYYLEVREYLTNKKEQNNDILENRFCDIYYKNQILTFVFKDSKNEKIVSIIIKDYKSRDKYVIDEKEKTYQIEKMDDYEERPKLIDSFHNSFKYNENIFLRYIFCFNPRFHISSNKNEYILKYNDVLKENIDKKTGIITYEESIDSSLRQTKRYYTVELDTDKDFEINLDDYTEVE